MEPSGQEGAGGEVPPGGAVAGRQRCAFGFGSLGGVGALLLAGLVALGKVLSWFEFQFSYLHKKCLLC